VILVDSYEQRTDSLVPVISGRGIVVLGPPTSDDSARQWDARVIHERQA
jgi:hypothetical protein